MSDKLDELLDKYEIIDTGHLYHHEHDAEELGQAIQQYVNERIVAELKKLSAIAKEHHDYMLPRASILEAIAELTSPDYKGRE